LREAKEKRTTFLDPAINFHQKGLERAAIFVRRGRGGKKMPDLETKTYGFGLKTTGKAGLKEGETNVGSGRKPVQQVVLPIFGKSQGGGGRHWQSEKGEHT